MANTCYSGKNAVLVINGRRILGFSDAEDSIDISYDEDPAKLIEGLSGATQVILSGSSTVGVTIKLLATHPDHAFLTALDGDLRGGICVPMKISFSEISTGEGGSSSAAVITKSASLGAGKSNSGEREWTISAGNWVQNAFNFV